MAIIGIKKLSFDGATKVQRRIFSIGLATLELGDPVIYVNGSGIEWYVFKDRRIDLIDVAYLGTIVAGLAQLPIGANPTRAQVITWVKTRIVLPKDIPGLDQLPVAARWQAVLDANSAPAILKAYSFIPRSLIRKKVA